MKNVVKLVSMMLVMAGMVACDKDNDSKVECPFYLNGIGYADLQQAIDAATSLKTEGSAEIMLIQDAEGKGAVIDADEEDDIIIDFQSYSYTLEPGRSLNIIDNYVQLAGDGGGIKASDDTPAIVMSDSSMVALTGGFTLKATQAISAKESFVVTFDYTGTVNGSMVLDGGEFNVFNSGCQISIPLLTVKGKGAALHADTEDETPQYTVTIDSLISEVEHPVTSVKEDIVHIGNADVHIHNMECTRVEGTCIVPDRMVMTCRECGYETMRILDTYGHCPVENLIYHAGKEATQLECGNQEYWECPLCQNSYSDKDGLKELEDGIIILGEAHKLGLDLLHGLDNGLDWDNEYQSTKVIGSVGIAVITTLIGLAGSAAFGIPGLVSKETSNKLQEISDKLDGIKEKLEVVENALKLIEKKIDVIPYRAEIIERNKELTILDKNTIDAFKVITEITKSDKPDTVKIKEITNVVSDWKENTYMGDKLYSMTQNMINLFSEEITDNKNYPQMHADFVNTLCRWEHEGYQMRYQMMLKDMSAIIKAYVLTSLYLNDVHKFNSEAMRKQQMESLKTSFDAYCKAITTELDVIKDREGKYRVLHIPTTVVFERTVKKYDFRRWFETHRNRCFPRNNDSGVAVASCDMIMADMGLNRDYLTPMQARIIHGLYNGSGKQSVSIYKILADSIRFYNCPSSYDPNIIFTMRNDGFSHEDDDSAKPTYKMWHWEAYRSRNNRDYFGIYTCLNNDATTANHNILYECDINSHSSGNINSLGKETRWIWNTILVAK